MPTKDPEKIRQISRRYYLKHRDEMLRKQRQNQQRIKNYLGIGLCPKCGKRGYILLHKKIYLPTGKEFGYGLSYEHRTQHKGKWIREGECWIPITPEEHAERAQYVRDKRRRTPLEASLVELADIEGQIKKLQFHRDRIQVRITILGGNTVASHVGC